MSRLLWAGVGAAGGIYLYRRGNRAWDDAKERGVAGNAAVIASSASTMLNHAKRTLSEAQEAKDAEMAEDQVAALPIREQDIQSWRRPRTRDWSDRTVDLPSDPQRVFAEDLPQRLWQDPQTDVTYEVRPVTSPRRGRRERRGAVSRSNPIKFIGTRNRSSA